jgi:hypothetical protein
LLLLLLLQLLPHGGSLLLLLGGLRERLETTAGSGSIVRQPNSGRL